MPQAIPWAAAVLAKAAIAVGVPTAAAKVAAVFVVKTAASMALSATAAMLAQPNVDRAGSPSQWRSNPDAPIPFLHGELKVAGNIVRRKAFGPENMYEGVVAIVSGAGPVEGPQSWMVERQAVTFGVDQKAVAPWGDKLWMSYQLGAQPEATALASPAGLRAGADLPGWGSGHKLSSYAAYMLTLGHDSKAKIWTRGEPEFAGIWRGVKCWDPRLDSTYPGGDGPQRRDDPTTWGYTTNGPLNALRWVRGHWAGPNGGVPHIDKLVGGMGVADELIDIASFVEGANAADALGFGMAGQPTTADDKWQVLKAMLQAAGCYPDRINGRVVCLVRAAAKTSLVTLERSDILGSIECARTPRRLDRRNTIKPRFRSPAHDYEMISAEAVTRAEYVTEDRGRRRSRQVDYPYVPDKDQAAILAAYDIADSREGLIGGMAVKPWLRSLRPGDCFTMPTSEDLGPLSGAKLLHRSREFDPENGGLAIGFRSETDEKHTWAQGITGVVTPPPTPQDPPITFPAPDAGDWSLAAGVSSVPTLLFFGEVTNPLAAQVQFAYRLDGAADWTPGPLADSNVTEMPVAVLSGGDWEGAVRYRSELTGIWGDWLLLGPVTVTGVVIDWPDQPPPDPSVTDGWDLLRRSGGGEFTGDLGATDGADWGVNVSGRPAELTDGRIGTALNSAGVLQTPIPSTLADTSDLLRRAGGGLFTGDLDANLVTDTSQLTDGANLGGTADWTGVGGRPANLAALSGSEAIQNSGITIGADGTLSGAGGGQVTLPGLGAGPLATSTLTEAEVRGRARGAFADEAAAVAATLLDGDNFYDEEQAVQKAKVGGAIVRISPLALYGSATSQADTDANYSASMPGTAVYSLTLPATTDADEFEARIHLSLQLGSPRTRASATTAADVPVPWELWCVPPSAPAFKVHEGMFTAQVRIAGGSTSSAREIVAWDGDLSANGYSSFGEEFAFPESGVHVLELRLHSQTSGNNLLDFTAAIEAKVFHFS